MGYDVVVDPRLQSATDCLIPIIALFQTLESPELEIQLGNIYNNEWESGVSEVQFNELLSMMNQFTEWKESNHSDCHDYVYSGRNGAVVRTRVHLNDFMVLEHCQKRIVSECVLRLEGHDFGKIVLRSSCGVSEDIIPETVEPSYVRIKKQKWFQYGPFCFKFFRIWQGPSRTIAESMQGQGITKYEIELEFIPDENYWNDSIKTSKYVATSLILKLVNLLS